MSRETKRAAWRIAALAAMVLFVVAAQGCSDDDGGTKADSSVSGDTGGGGGDTGGGGGDTGGGGGDTGGGGGDTGGGSADAGGGGAVPTEKNAMFTFLKDKKYAAWTHKESKAHASSGPHGQVRTFINDSLFNSLTAKTDHAVGAATVKELFDGSNNLKGWAVWVKTDTDSNAGGSGKGIYWYEVFSTTTNNPVADGQGAAGCVGCHASGAADFFKTPFPLQ